MVALAIYAIWAYVSLEQDRENCFVVDGACIPYRNDEQRNNSLK